MRSIARNSLSRIISRRARPSKRSDFLPFAFAPKDNEASNDDCRKRAHLVETHFPFYAHAACNKRSLYGAATTGQLLKYIETQTCATRHTMRGITKLRDAKRRQLTNRRIVSNGEINRKYISDPYFILLTVHYRASYFLHSIWNKRIYPVIGREETKKKKLQQATEDADEKKKNFNTNWMLLIVHFSINSKNGRDPDNTRYLW